MPGIIEHYLGKGKFGMVTDEKEMEQMIVSGKVKYALVRVVGKDEHGNETGGHTFMVYKGKDGTIRTADIGARQNNGGLYKDTKDHWNEGHGYNTFKCFIFIK